MWLSLEDYQPWWVMDSLTDEYILVCNIDEYEGEGFRKVRTPVNKGDTLDFESLYVQEELITPTHFMLIEYPA